jgi:hypothetical protein
MKMGYHLSNPFVAFQTGHCPTKRAQMKWEVKGATKRN